MSRKKKKKTTTKKWYWVIAVFLVIVISGAFVGGYFYGKKSVKNKAVVCKKNIQNKKVLEELQKLVAQTIKANQKHNKIIKKQKTKINTKTIINSEALDYQENSNKPTKHINPIIYTNKPKLVIIMDDMSFYYEVKKLKKLGLKITPSFFPPTKRHPNTAIYAKEFSHYMVHFPMQAMNPNFHEEPETLHVNSSYKFILSRVLFIKKEFPKDKFVNNHTGSKFTSNIFAMRRLYRALDKEGLIFVDSRTTAKTKAPIVAKEFGKLLLSRDVFLDNIPNIKYIQNQLKKAIEIAKKRGYAIAICHPHPKTFAALAQSKKLLKNVELVYIDELYKLAKQHKLSRL